MERIYVLESELLAIAAVHVPTARSTRRASGSEEAPAPFRRSEEAAGLEVWHEEAHGVRSRARAALKFRSQFFLSSSGGGAG